MDNEKFVCDAQHVTRASVRIIPHDIHRPVDITLVTSLFTDL